MNQVRIGVVGTGEIARMVHLPVLLAMKDEIRVNWVYDQDRAKAQSIAESFKLSVIEAFAPERLPAVDVVLLTVPVWARPAYIDTCAAGGKAVFSEKPFALSAAAHRQYCDLFPDYRLACGFMRRMYGNVRLLRQIVAEKWFGPVRKITLSEGGRTTRTFGRSSDRRGAQARAAGVMMEIGCHGVNTLSYIVQATAFKVQTCQLILDEEVDLEARLQFTLGSETEDVVPVEFNVSWLNPMANRIGLAFDTVEVEAPITAGRTCRVRGLQKDSMAREIAFDGTGASTMYQAFGLEWRSFLRGLQQSSPSEVSARSALLTTELIETVLQQNGMK